jgi:hypothetical protein
MTVEELEIALLGLLKGQHSNLTISYNDENGPNYMTVREYVEQGMSDQQEWLSEAERQRAMELNQMWTLQWYPNTPVGFHWLSASSLPALIEHVLRNKP